MPVVTPTLVLCDTLVAKLKEAWVPVAPSGAERRYLFRAGDADSGPALELKGRRVVFYPRAYSDDPETRESDNWSHRISVQVYERFEEGGDPPTEWIDERVDWVHTQIAKAFDWGAAGPEWNPALLTESVDVLLYDIGKLFGNQLFFSQVDFVFSELRGN